MLFTWFHISNYKSYWEDFYINFSQWFLDDPDKNIFLIWAENWTWKTSFIKALKCLLYWFKYSNWKPLKREEIAALMNNTSSYDKWMSFQLDYVSDAWENLSLKRSRSIMWWDKLSILRDGVVLNTPEDEIENYINNMIPEWISKFFFFTWEDVKIFTEEESKKWLKEPIEVVLWINKYSELIKNLTKLKSKLTSILNFNWDFSTEWLQKLEKELEDIYNEQWLNSANTEKLKNELDKLTEEKEDKEKKMNKLFQWEILEQQSRIEEDLRNNRNKQDRIKDQIEKWKWEMQFMLLKHFCKNISDEIKYSKEVNKANAFQSEIDATIKALYQPEELISHTKRDDKFYDIIYKKLSELHWENVVNRKDFVLDINAHQEMEINNAIYSITHSSGLSIETLARDLSTYEKLKRDEAKMEEEKSKLTINTSWQEEWKSLNSDVWKLTEQITLKKSAISRLAMKWWTDFQDRIRKKEAEISKYKEDMSKQWKITEKIDRIEEYIKLLTKYINRLRSSMVEKTEEVISEKYKDICHEDIKCVKIDRDTYEISIIDSNDSVKVTHELWDAEKTLFALSIIRWLWKISELDLPLIMDAPIAPLDAEHKENFLKKYLPKAWKQVVLFSNSEHIEPTSDYYNIFAYVYNEKTLRKKSWEWEKTEVIIKDWYFKN